VDGDTLGLGDGRVDAAGSADMDEPLRGDEVHRHGDFIGMGRGNMAKDGPDNSEAPSNKTTFLVQEFCNSGSLQKVIETQMNKGTSVLKAYTRSQVLEWMLDIAHGIKYLHESSPKILHRDLKLGEPLGICFLPKR
jgi:serine/threonine protein kinase